ncbi:MAG TPA: hypothetical protein VM938_15570 [Acidimicrobiales bacterium]|nr:hypothetical protein [Acidimicrobiales bacterium]
MNARRARLTAAVAVLLLSAPMGSASGEEAGPSATGWWTQRPLAEGKPSGGVEVAWAGPVGAESVAALRFADRLGPDDGAVLHLLDVVLEGAPAVRACPTDDAWKPANPGAWAEAPVADCETSVAVTPNGENRWSADVSGLLAGASSMRSVMLVPYGVPAAAGVPVTSPFRLTVGRAALVVTPGDDSSDGGGDDGDDFGGGFDPGFGAGLGQSAPGLTAPELDLFAPQAAPTSTTTAPAAPAAEAAPELASTRFFRGSAAAGALWAVVAIALGAMVVWSTTRRRPNFVSGVEPERRAVNASAVGAALMLAGAVGVWLAWRGAARTLLDGAQWPWLVSGGLGGLALASVGATLFQLHAEQADAAAEDAELDALLEAAAAAVQRTGIGTEVRHP